ncbi:MAG: autotransporter-associated beta strand repeat-containing protein, partial [Candidatus Accumulibacter sp.]|nr:autotransporter-associated beta strand repeat-containing protein [Accumulibacter sp.]
MLGIHTPPFQRRLNFLCIEAALAALVLSVPMTAGAAASISIENSSDPTAVSCDTDVGTCISSNSYSFSSTLDPLTGEAGAAFVPGAGSPVASHNTVTITDVGSNSEWTDTVSVAGGGVLSGNDDVTNNSVVLRGGDTKITGLVVGGVIGDTSSTGTLSNNQVTLKNGEVNKDVIGGLGLGSGEISENTVKIEGGVVKGNVSGGWAGVDLTGSNASSSDVKNNHVVITGGTIGESGSDGSDVSGGISQTGVAEGNTVNISGGTITGSVTGGYVQNKKGESITAGASGNTVVISDAENAISIGTGGDTGNVRGGEVASSSSGSVTGNSVTIKGRGTITGDVTGGFSQHDNSVVGGDDKEDGNKVSITNLDASNALTVKKNIQGGRTMAGAAKNNTVFIEGNVVAERSIYGGVSVNGGNVSGNIVTLKGAVTDSGAVVGGYSYQCADASCTATGGDATGNKVFIEGTGGTFTNVVGGWGNGSGVATGNEVNIDGNATITTVYGGRVSGSGAATGNEVNIDGNATITNVYGGFESSGDVFTDNELNKKSAEAAITGTAYNFAEINFSYAGKANIGTLDTTVPASASGSLVKLNTGGNDIEFNGKITGSGGIEKTGTGTLTLDDVNDYNYTGATKISAGTLSVLGSLTGTSGVTVGSDAIFELRNSASTTAVPVVIGNSSTGNLTVNENGTLRVIIDNPEIYSSTDPVLKVGGTATIESGAKLDVSLNKPMGDTLYLLSAGTFDASNGFDNFNGNSSFYYGELTEYIVEVDGNGKATKKGTKASGVSKSYSEGNISSAVMLMQGSDVAADQAMSSAVSVGSSVMG